MQTLAAFSYMEKFLPAALVVVVVALVLAWEPREAETIGAEGGLRVGGVSFLPLLRLIPKTSSRRERSAGKKAEISLGKVVVSRSGKGLLFLTNGNSMGVETRSLALAARAPKRADVELVGGLFSPSTLLLAIQDAPEKTFSDWASSADCN